MLSSRLGTGGRVMRAMKLIPATMAALGVAWIWLAAPGCANSHQEYYRQTHDTGYYNPYVGCANSHQEYYRQTHDTGYYNPYVGAEKQLEDAREDDNTLQSWLSLFKWNR
jgi:hypothetical protein